MNIVKLIQIIKISITKRKLERIKDDYDKLLLRLSKLRLEQLSIISKLNE